MINIQNKVLKMKDDIMFKAFFSRTGNEEFLKELLTAILGKEVEISRVIHDAKLEQLSKENKYGILDLEVELKSKEIINVEMQLRNFNNIEQRTTFYASKKITEQLGAKQEYDKIKKVIVIAILDYSFIGLPEYVTDTIRVAKKHKEYTLNNEVEYIYIELEKFRRQNPDMKEPLNQWLAFLDMERGDLLEMAMKENKKIKEAVQHYNELSGDEATKRLAEVRIMADMEERAALASARDKGTKEGWKIGTEEGLRKGKEEGLKQGKEEGLKQGKEEGLKQGKEEGLKQEKIRTVKKMLELKIDVKKIQEIVGLTKEEILKIKNQIK